MWEELYEDHYKELVAYGTRMSGSKELAEDLVQESSMCSRSTISSLGISSAILTTAQSLTNRPRGCFSSIHLVIFAIGLSSRVAPLGLAIFTSPAISVSTASSLSLCPSGTLTSPRTFCIHERFNKGLRCRKVLRGSGGRGHYDLY